MHTTADKREWNAEASAFDNHTHINEHLASLCVRSLMKYPSRELIIDYSTGRKAYKAATILAISLELSRSLRETRSKEARIGIVLPPGAGAMIANLAVLLSGKTPVNLNFTLSTESIRSCIRRSQIRTAITAKPIIQRAKHFAWPDNTLEIKECIENISKRRLLWTLFQTSFLNPERVIRSFDLPTKGGDQEASLLFTSGSSGDPKGVVLTHRNIIGNIEQIAHNQVLKSSDTITGTLPVFHSFGFTVSLFFPILKGIRVVSLPSPLEVNKIADMIEAEQATVHIGTPTFFRSYIKKVKPEKLTSLRAVVAGAEKTPSGFHERWENAFGSKYLEGYGLTETAPVVSCNLPSSTLSRSGSVGKPMPGMRLRILDPDTLEPQSIHQRGLLGLKGINIFNGYLNQAKETEEVFDSQGFFITGDLARIDEEGFLYIEGRLARFSKIGGEMVPHLEVERIIAETLKLETSENPEIAITARTDEAKGEALVLVTTFKLDIKSLKQKLKSAKAPLPNLWQPKDIITVESIPILASGKLDLKRLKELAQYSKWKED